MGKSENGCGANYYGQKNEGFSMEVLSISPLLGASDQFALDYLNFKIS